jgi:DnaK suppressor protein
MSYSDPSQGVVMKQESFIPDSYTPAEDEPFMNERQVEYFRRKLLDWKNDLMSDSKETIEGLQDGTRNIPDIADRASEETDRALELRTRDRQRKLVSKIDAALRFLEGGGTRVIIAHLDQAGAALRGEAGTHVVAEGHG